MTLLLAVFTATAWAQYQYIKRSWDGSMVVETTKSTSSYFGLNGNNSNEEVTMDEGQDYVVTADATYKRLIAPSGTAANLILCDGTTLNAQITINKGCKLNIYCQSGGTGTINAKAIESYYYAAIGTVGGGAFSGTAWLNKQGYGPVYAGNVLYSYKGAAPVGITLQLKTGTTGIATAALSQQSGIADITLPTSIKNIGEEAFLGCKGITTIVLPRGITTLPAMNLYGCSNLTSVVVPESVTRISDYAFSGCTGLEEVVVLRTNPPTVTQTAFDEETRKTAILRVPVGSLNRYRSHPYWTTFSYIAEIGGTIDDYYDKLKRGDMDADGIISVADITELIRFYLEEVGRALK